VQGSNVELMGEIRGVFAEKWAIEVDSPTLDLLDTGVVDSVMLVELLLELEQRFAVSLPLETLEIEDFRSVARIADLVARMRPAPVRAGPTPGLGIAANTMNSAPSAAA